VSPHDDDLSSRWRLPGAEGEYMVSGAASTSEEVERIAADGPVSGLRDQWMPLTIFTDEMLTSATVTDATLEQLLVGYGPTTTRRYIATIAWFSLPSPYLPATRVPLEETDEIGSRTIRLGCNRAPSTTMRHLKTFTRTARSRPVGVSGTHREDLRGPLRLTRRRRHPLTTPRERRQGSGWRPST